MKCTNLLSTMKPKDSIYGNLLFKLSIFEVNLQVAPLPKITAVDSTLTESGPTQNKLRPLEKQNCVEPNEEHSLHWWWSWGRMRTVPRQLAPHQWQTFDENWWILKVGKIEECGRSSVSVWKKWGRVWNEFSICVGREFWTNWLWQNQEKTAQKVGVSAHDWRSQSDPMHNTTCRVVYLQSCLRFCAPSCNLSGTLMGPTLLVEGVNCVKLQCKEIAWDFAQTSTNINWLWLLQKFGGGGETQKSIANFFLVRFCVLVDVINSFGGGGSGFTNKRWRCDLPSDVGIPKSKVLRSRADRETIFPEDHWFLLVTNTQPEQKGPDRYLLGDFLPSK